MLHEKAKIRERRYNCNVIRCRSENSNELANNAPDWKDTADQFGNPQFKDHIWIAFATVAAATATPASECTTTLA